VHASTSSSRYGAAANWVITHPCGKHCYAYLLLQSNRTTVVKIIPCNAEEEFNEAGSDANEEEQEPAPRPRRRRRI